jgi:hypothetical protein
MKKRKFYVKPSMKVHELKRRAQLLVGSNGSGTLDDYNWNTPDEE